MGDVTTRLDHPLFLGLSRRGFFRASSTIGLAAAFNAPAGHADTAVHRHARSIEPPPVWFDDAKLGVFIHWNAAAIPAFAPIRGLHDVPGSDQDPSSLPVWRQNQLWRTLPYAEMYQNTMAVPGSETAHHHAEHHGNRSYDEFVAEFRDERIHRWDPESWAELVAAACAGYVILSTKTEDGFLLWPSDHPNPHRRDWQSSRDVVGELAEALRAKDIRFGTYYCGGMDWTFGGIPIVDFATLVAALPQSRDYRDYVDAHWRELIDRYQPSVLWNDYAYPPGADLSGLFQWYLTRVPDGAVNNRFDQERQNNGDLTAHFLTPEYVAEGSPERKWETCRGIGTSFGYNAEESDLTYLSADELIQLFVDVVARGGNLLINIGPTADGPIPQQQDIRLRALGRWLHTHRDGIVGTRPWAQTVGITTSGRRIRYTATTDRVYAFVLGAIDHDEVGLDIRLDHGASVTIVGHPDPLSWYATEHGVRIAVPPEYRDITSAIGFQLTPGTAAHPFST